MDNEFDVNDMSDERYDIPEYDGEDEDEEEEDENYVPFCGYKGRACGCCSGCLE